MDKETKALQLRTKALALLEEAATLDGLKPYSVTHRHEYGASTYLLWSLDEPDEDDAVKVLDADYEPDEGEELDIETSLTLEELTGVAVTARLPDILAATEEPTREHMAKSRR